MMNRYATFFNDENAIFIMDLAYSISNAWKNNTLTMTLLFTIPTK